MIWKLTFTAKVMNLIWKYSKTLLTASLKGMIKFFLMLKMMPGRDSSHTTRAMELIKTSRTGVTTGASALLSRKILDVSQGTTEKIKQDHSAPRKFLSMNLATMRQTLPSTTLH